MDELLKEAKLYLDITWDDDDTDKKLKGQISRGIALISAKTGVSAEPETYQITGNLRAQALLFNYLLYDRAGALDQFMKAYASEILALKLLYDVDRSTT